MTLKGKLEYIGQNIEDINKMVLKNKKWKLRFENRGANNYYLMFVQNKKELIIRKFDTYGSVIGCLDIMAFMFQKALEEKNKKGE